MTAVNARFNKIGLGYNRCIYYAFRSAKVVSESYRTGDARFHFMTPYSKLRETVYFYEQCRDLFSECVSNATIGI
jgi:hypothetical protein